MNTSTSARPTIRTVAEACGVSISTVSRALNGGTSNDELVQRVRRVAHELGYVPSSLARSFKNQQLNQVLFAVEDIGNAAYVTMMKAAESVLKEAGLRILVHSTAADTGTELDLVHSLQQRFVDGLIISPLRVTDNLLESLESASCPIVTIGNLPHRAESIDNVRVDSAKGAEIAVDHLFASGCSRVGLINGPIDTTPGEARHRGYHMALQKAGITADESLIVVANGFGFENGLAVAHKLQNLEFDGLLAATDALAVSAIHSLNSRGISVPEDVRVVGMDDAQMARSSLPPLTSVNLGAQKRGELAAQILVDRLKTPDLPTRVESVTPYLTVRNSTT